VWLDNGCCDYVKRFDPREREAHREHWRLEWRTRICDEAAAHNPPDRARLRDQCNQFDHEFREWPDCCQQWQIVRESAAQTPGRPNSPGQATR
jgi:hypothetical protein